jgi:hypothetical protein
MILHLNRWEALMKSPFRKLGFAPLIAAGLLFGDAAARDEQAAHADNWQLYGSNTGSYCEGCCRPGFLCCELPSACRVPAGEA